jgi:nucleotide-binding universal stress UspA family protein
MNGSIVTAVDGSPDATEAARVAAMLARHLGRRIVLAHVAVDPPVFPYGDSRRRAIQRRHAIRRGRRLLDDIATAIGVPAAKKRVTFPGLVNGEVEQRLADLCREEEADLLLLGSRTEGVVMRALFGDASLCERTRAHAERSARGGGEVAQLRAA